MVKQLLIGRFSIWMIIVLGISMTSMFVQAQGDRAPGVNCVYPEDAFMHAEKGGRIIDVTQPPFNAVGDGITDDTDAFVHAYDSVLAIMDSYGWDRGQPASYQCTNIIYIPDGTYRITNTIIYSGPSRYNHPNERLARIRFVGQSREGTLLKLDDSCDGYERGTNKALLSFGRGDFNNGVAFNAVRNLTLNTGSGNPGAVALDFEGANNSSIQNMTIKSDDGEGSIGLYLRIGPNMGYHNDITIEGFDYGVYALPYHFGINTFEYITLRNQKKAAFRTDNSALSIRKLLSENTVPAVSATESGAHVVIIDSELNSSSDEGAAIDLRSGQLFARNITVNGYEHEILDNYMSVELPVAGQIEEYVSGEIFSLREGQRLKSLNMEIEENPVIPWENDMDQWANVNDYGAVGDGVTNDKEAIQAAMNSGKSTIYFPNAEYKIQGGLVTVPATVKRINFMYGRLMGRLKVNEDASDPLLIEDGLSKGAVILHYAPRTIICSNFSGNYKNHNTVYGAKLFLNNVTNFGKSDENFVNQKVWVRYMNTEFKSGPNFIANNSEMWVLGYKVEGNTTNFVVKNGGTLEVLGGIINEWPGGSDFSASKPPALINDRSEVCYIAFSNGPYTLVNAIKEISDSGTEYITEDMMPDRTGEFSEGDYFIPMYVSYESEGDTTFVKNHDPGKQPGAFALRYSPLSQQIWVDADDHADGPINIYDINGRIRQVSRGEMPVSVSDLENGVYLVEHHGRCAKLVKY